MAPQERQQRSLRCSVWSSAVALAFLRVAKPSTGHGRAAAFLYIAQVSLWRKRRPVTSPAEALHESLGGGSRSELRPTSLPPPTPFQALTSASQGFLNCLVYGWTTVHLRQVGLTALSRDANSQTPLLQPQPTRNYKSLRALC